MTNIPADPDPNDIHPLDAHPLDDDPFGDEPTKKRHSTRPVRPGLKASAIAGVCFLLLSIFGAVLMNTASPYSSQESVGNYLNRFAMLGMFGSAVAALISIRWNSIQSLRQATLSKRKPGALFFYANLFGLNCLGFLLASMACYAFANSVSITGFISVVDFLSLILIGVGICFAAFGGMTYRPYWIGFSLALWSSRSMAYDLSISMINNTWMNPRANDPWFIAWTHLGVLFRSMWVGFLTAVIFGLFGGNRSNSQESDGRMNDIPPSDSASIRTPSNKS